MKRDLIVHHLVALDAQLRRVRALAGSIGSPAELQARLPALIDESCRTLDRVMGQIRRQEGTQPPPAARDAWAHAQAGEIPGSHTRP